MLNLNHSIFTAVVEQARRDAAQHPRWLKAINRAVAELENNPYIERQDGSLLIASSTSSEIYSANGICQCVAYTGVDSKTGIRLHNGGQPCWHRAAARLVRRHDEQQAIAETAQRILAALEVSQPVATETVVERGARRAKAYAEIDELYA